MKFTLKWLKEHLDTNADVATIARTLTMTGLEVEHIEDRAKDLAPFTIGYVVEAVQHPNADKLRVCKVETGQGVVQVVCGAPNARTGMKGVFAPVGSFIPACCARCARWAWARTMTASSISPPMRRWDRASPPTWAMTIRCSRSS
jgi:hypothetical protein